MSLDGIITENVKKINNMLNEWIIFLSTKIKGSYNYIYDHIVNVQQYFQLNYYIVILRL